MPIRALTETPEEEAQVDQIRDALGNGSPWLDIYNLWIYRLYLKPKFSDGEKNTDQATYLSQIKRGGLGNTTMISDAMRELH